MRCPDCELDLLLADRTGVEINYCPKCRGIWLERGKLDRLIERSIQGGAPVQRGTQVPGYPPDPNYPYQSRPNYDHDDYDDDRDDHDHRDNGYGPNGKRKRRGGFLGDLLDFG